VGIGLIALITLGFIYAVAAAIRKPRTKP
jgi:hypothetical protein